MGNIVQLNETEIKKRLGEMVRKTVKDTLNAMLDAVCEGINSTIQAAKRKARGFNAYERYGAMIYLGA